MEDAVTNTMLGGKTGNLAEENVSRFLFLVDYKWAFSFCTHFNFCPGYPLLLRHNAAHGLSH